MIDKKELARFATFGKIRNVGYAEKEYIQDLILYELFSNTKDELVFKGGTAIYKFYGLRRFSEDLDFSLNKNIDINKIENYAKKIRDFGIEISLKNKKTPFDSVLLSFSAKGPLYNGSPNSMCSIRIYIIKKSRILMKPLFMIYTSKYPEVPMINMLVMDPREIAAEKVRSIIMRDKARDVYDLWYLLRANYVPNETLISKKMEYYNIKWNKKELKERLMDKAKIWEKELKSIIFDDIPNFDIVYNYIINKID